VEVRDEYDVVHRLWPVADAQTIECIRNEMADKKLVIADGHHRYETALAYRNECRAALGATDPNAPHEKVMMTFVNTQAEGLTILPPTALCRTFLASPGMDFASNSLPISTCAPIPFGPAGARARYAEFREDLRQPGARAPGNWFVCGWRRVPLASPQTQC